MSRQDTYEYDVLAHALRRWWRGLQGLSPDDGSAALRNGAPKSPERGALAEMRRIDVVEEAGQNVVDVGHAMSIPAFQALIVEIRRSKLPHNSIIRRHIEAGEVESFAIAAATLARVRSDVGGDQARRGETAALLGKGDRDDHVFAEPRFKRLIRCRNDATQLMAHMRRVAAILERSAPVGDLGASIVLWDDDPRIRRDWAFAYYGRGFASPGNAPADDAGDDAAATPPSAPTA